MADGTPTETAANVRYVTSADGSRIAYETFGRGPAVILIGGALNDRNGRASGVALARLMSADFTVYAYDRRGRGASVAVQPSSVEREIDDLRALVDAAGGSSALFGMSSGGALALAAAAAGLPVTRIALYEPPFSVSSAALDRSKAYDARLRELVEAGDNDGALALFLETIGMPPQVVAGMRQGPAWRALTGLAATLVQDAAVLNSDEGAPVPTARLAKIAVPVLAMAGDSSPPSLRQAAEAVATAARRGSHRILPGQTHDVAIAALAPALTPFFLGQTQPSGRPTARPR